MKILLMALLVLGFVGCKDTVKVSCPECTVKSVDGVREIECKKCSVEAEFSEDFKLIQRPERP